MAAIIECGVSVAIPEREMPVSKSDVEAFGPMLGGYLAEELAEYVGGATPRSEYRFRLQPPVDDPLQGRIRLATLSADYRPDDLPSSSKAYADHLKENRP